MIKLLIFCKNNMYKFYYLTYIYFNDMTYFLYILIIYFDKFRIYISIKFHNLITN